MGLRQIAFGALMWAVFVYALRRGAWAERLAAGSIIANAYLTVLVDRPLAYRFKGLETPVLLVDLALLLVLLFISLRSDKFWPLWLTAMHALAILAHLSPLVPNMLPWGYWRAVATWSWPMLITLGLAVRHHHREQMAGLIRP
jgi:hypothetical protein